MALLVFLDDNEVVDDLDFLSSLVDFSSTNFSFLDDDDESFVSLFFNSFFRL